ncbi:MAG: LicD family protein [Candidatus Marinimicrobia bacterium]|nr:LicD family protein [Candidatus Neomarinimicrobiota bacterium]
MAKWLSIHQKFKTKLFKDVTKLLNNAKVPFWLDFDTLLGVWSANNDKDLSREKDIYLSINQKHLDNLQNVLKKIGFLYRIYSFPNRSGREWIPGKIITLGVFNSWKQIAYYFKLVIFVKYKQNDEFRWIHIRNCKHIADKHYTKLDKIMFDGNTYNIPSKTDEYLNYSYGNWQEISEQWMHQINDGTLVCDSIINSVPTKVIERKITKDNIKLHDSDNHSRMKKMLLFTIDQLQENNIPFWLEAGTLLGIYRDGDLISWDYDADISIPAEYSDKVVALRYIFLPRFIIRKRPIYSRWITGDTRVVKIKTTWEKLQQVNFHIDLFCVYKVSDKYRWVDSGVLKQADAKYFDTQDIIEWEGRKIPIPAHAEEYLSLRYGNWRIPSKNYIAGLHDGAIAERGF